MPFCTSGPAEALLVRDLDVDGILDIVALFPEENRIRVFQCRPNGTFANDLIIAAPAYSRSLDVADVNSDGLLDIIVVADAFSAGGQMWLYLGRRLISRDRWSSDTAVSLDGSSFDGDARDRFGAKRVGAISLRADREGDFAQDLALSPVSPKSRLIPLLSASVVSTNAGLQTLKRCRSIPSRRISVRFRPILRAKILNRIGDMLSAFFTQPRLEIVPSCSVRELIDTSQVEKRECRYLRARHQ